MNWLYALLLFQPIESFELEFSYTSFYKGNTHTHTNRSDGDSPPSEVLKWYKEHEYNFVVLTDHNIIQQKKYKKIQNENFQFINGEEVSFSSDKESEDQPKKVPVHVNALCAQESIPKNHVSPVKTALRQAITEILSQGAIAQINHPNFGWALRFDDIVYTSGAQLLEVANQHPHVFNEGNSKHLSTEVLWDKLLTASALYYGIASDDMHDLWRDPGYEPRRPGKGWVQVASEELNPEKICEALHAGRFYSSTGVELDYILVKDQVMGINIVANPHETYTTTFVGRGGKILSQVKGTQSFYVLKGEEGYVRAKIESSSGKQAWVQPVYTSSFFKETVPVGIQ